MELEIERKREEREETKIQVCYLREKVGEMEAGRLSERKKREKRWRPRSISRERRWDRWRLR